MKNNYLSGCKAIADEQTKRINSLEEKLARKYYGRSFKELDEDTQGEITMDVYDIINGTI